MSKEDKSFDINLTITPIRNGYLMDNVYYETILECLKEHIKKIEEQDKKKKFNIKMSINE
jgi:predicted glycosyl hydrolase (DUF1957 family)